MSKPRRTHFNLPSGSCAQRPQTSQDATKTDSPPLHGGSGRTAPERLDGYECGSYRVNFFCRKCVNFSFVNGSSRKRGRRIRIHSVIGEAGRARGIGGPVGEMQGLIIAQLLIYCPHIASRRIAAAIDVDDEWVLCFSLPPAERRVIMSQHTSGERGREELAITRSISSSVRGERQMTMNYGDGRGRAMAQKCEGGIAAQIAQIHVLFQSCSSESIHGT